jgi:type III secretion system FlhB-like substrate exporter
MSGKQLEACTRSPGARRLLAVLGAAGAIATLYRRVLRTRHLTWGTKADEAQRALPGDELMPAARVVATRAVEIDAPPAAVWPWLVQMGPGRAGAYTYDWIERRLGIDIRNVRRIVPELQQLAVGDEIPMPGYAMCAEIVDHERTLAFRSTDGRWVWSFELVPTGDGTRLLSRNRIDTSGYRVKDWIGYAITEPGSWVMERKMLLTIKQLAERAAGGERHVAARPAPIAA